MICNMDSIGKYMLEIILHQQRTPQFLKQKKLMQTQEDHSNPIPALNIDSLKVDLVVIQNICSEKEDTNSETASSKSVKESNLQVLSKEDLKGTRIEHGFKWAFMSLFGQDADTFTSTMLLNFSLDYDSQMTDKYFVEYTGIEEKVFAIAALKNDLRKLKGNSVDTKFDKTSVLGKPVLQSPRNQLVVRQPNAFKSERPQMSKQWFASQVDVNNNLSKPVTQHYLPKKRESVFAKHDHMIASSESRNSSKNMPRFSSNDMVHNHYLDEAKKKTQERDRNSKTSVTPFARFQSTADNNKPKPRNNNQTPKSLHVSKSSRVTIMVVPKADHSKSSSSFSDSKNFVCSTCHKCVFNVNNDACITKLLKEVNSRAKTQSHKTRNSNKLADQKSHTQKPARQIFT
ncbi:hypothetical protein Tco_0646264 [Tanacetum coccineum]